MPLFIVKNQIQIDKTLHPVGSEIELTVERAKELADCLINPPLAPAPKDKQLAKALASQANRPVMHEQSWQRDLDSVANDRAKAALLEKPEQPVAPEKKEPVAPEKKEKKKEDEK